MKTAVIGCRDFIDYKFLCETLDQYEITQVVSGGAKGADRLAEVWSLERGLPKPIIFEAEWLKYGKAAGMIRNQDVINEAEQVIAFWDEVSPGTGGAIKLAEQAGKPLLVVKITPDQQDKKYNWSCENPLLKPLCDSKRPPLIIG